MLSSLGIYKYYQLISLNEAHAVVYHARDTAHSPATVVGSSLRAMPRRTDHQVPRVAKAYMWVLPITVALAISFMPAVSIAT